MEYLKHTHMQYLTAARSHAQNQADLTNKKHYICILKIINFSAFFKGNPKPAKRLLNLLLVLSNSSRNVAFVLINFKCSRVSVAYFVNVPSHYRGTAVAHWLRCCTTNQKVAGSNPAGVSGFFINTKSFRSHYGPGVDSASIRNEYQEYFLGVKAAGA